MSIFGRRRKGELWTLEIIPNYSLSDAGRFFLTVYFDGHFSHDLDAIVANHIYTR